MFTPKDINAFKEKAEKTDILIGGGNVNSLNDRSAFINDITKKGLFSGNPKPDLVIDLTVPNPLGESLFFRTWQELCYSDAWFYGAVCRPLATRQFMFCFTNGVYVRSGKGQNGNLSDGFIDYEEFEKENRPDAWKSPRPWKFVVKDTFIYYQKRNENGRGYSDVVHAITQSNGKKDAIFGLLYEFLHDRFAEEAESARKIDAEKAAQKEAHERQKAQLEKEKEIERVRSFFQEQLKEFDKDGNGQVDVVESDDFQSLLNTNQAKIIEINRDYVQHFVKVSTYLKTKRAVIQRVFEMLVEVLDKGGEKVVDDLNLAQFGGAKLMAVKYVVETMGMSLKEAKNAVEDWYTKNGGEYVATNGIIPIDEAKAQMYVDSLKDEIHLYNLLLVHAFAMVEALVQDNMVLFYEIHQKFDDLNIFDTKHQRDVATSLENTNASVNKVNASLSKVTQAIQDLGNDIVLAIGDLSSITEESSRLVESALDSVNSSIQANSLISSVQMYQLRQISKNTRSLRE